MARGPKKHLRRLNAPKTWCLDKLSGQWAPRPSTGPHKMRACLPLVLILRNRLRYALTRREVTAILMSRSTAVKVDGVKRTDPRYPAGFMDVVSIEKTGENFRLLYDAKGRFVLKEIDEKEAEFKLLRVKKYAKSAKAYAGKNPLANGQAASIPYIVTHDGRTIRYPLPTVKPGDSIKYNLKTGKVEEHFKFATGAVSMITGGHNMGRVGVITRVEKHPGSFDIVHVKDKAGHTFATRISNVFVIGNEAPAVSLPKQHGVKQSIIEERDARLKKD
ncbi:MAG: hypothetical protein MHM6MM_004830 [Cercozoa sp. M6MM]